MPGKSPPNYQHECSSTRTPRANSPTSSLPPASGDSRCGRRRAPRLRRHLHGGGYTLHHSAFDPRISALALVAAIGADSISPTPTLIVHGRIDGFCPPEEAAKIHQRISGPTELVWLDTTNHIDLYDQRAYAEAAVARMTAWMTEHL
jgi:fermentation-respiration switch protein FrsA (DUF1100 family)